MTAVVSCPWPLKHPVWFALSGGRAIPTMEAPEIDRVYLCVPVDEQFAQCNFDGLADIAITYFATARGAQVWGDQDVERRLDGEEL